MALFHINFFSHALGMACSMDAIIPQYIPQEGNEDIGGVNGITDPGPYQTLYLLHGMSDDHTIWQRRTSIERYVEGLPLAVIMPGVDLSFYTDMHHGLKYWEFISEELPLLCEHFFPLSTKREDRFAAGLSMGGYGALKLGLRASDKFSYAASLSGAADMASREQTSDVMVNIFSNRVKPEDDLMKLATKLKESGKPMPKLYQWCGTEDFLYEANLKFRDHVRKLGYDLSYQDGPGDHQWKYWDTGIQYVLDWLPIKK